ncbi:inositol monophosphatase family protein [Candidatus Nitrospira bockiana]
MTHELDVLERAMRAAGKQVLELAVNGFETHIKKDRSPVTTADIAVNRLLREALLTAFPGDAWLSEEVPDDLARLHHERVWVIDPIDGTKYFMRGVPQYAISVALVTGGQPAVAAIYNPPTDEMFTAVRGEGARLNGAPIRVQRSGSSRPVVFVNPSAFDRGRFGPIADAADCRPLGSIAYTLACVAAGRADGTINLDRLNEWDVAAGVLIVIEAGGAALDALGRPLAFNQPKTAIKGIVAAGPDGLEAMLELARRLSAS